MPSGQGKITFADGGGCEGNFKDVDIYEGNFEDMAKVGLLMLPVIGKFTFVDGTIYEVGTELDKRKITYPNGDIYEGGFYDG